MTSVTSFTRTPRGLPRDQWAPCRIEDETSSLLCGRPTDPSFSQVSQKREGNLSYIISLLSIIQEEIQHLFFSFFLPSKNRSKIRVMREKGGGAGGFFEKLLESYHVFPRFTGESATTTTLLRRIDATWSTTEGLACPQGGREMGRGLEATKRVGGAVPWWPPVRYSFLRVTRADLYDP